MTPAQLRIAALAILAMLSGCSRTIPPGSICVDGKVWEPNNGTTVMTPLRDFSGWQEYCVPAPKDSR